MREIMSTHVEWEDYAPNVAVEVLTAEDAEEELQPETPLDRPFVLVLGSGGGGAFATSGTRTELATLARKILRLIEVA